MRNGLLYRRPQPELRTSAIASSFWPSARSEDAECCGNHPGQMDSLTGATSDWNTPQAADAGGFPREKEKRIKTDRQTRNAEFEGNFKLDLKDQVGLWSTPSGQMFNDGESPESWQQRAKEMEEKHHNGNGAGMPLGVQASLWATPQATDTPQGQGWDLTRLLRTCLNSSKPIPTEVIKSFLQNLLNGRRGKESLPKIPKSHRPRLNPHFTEWLMNLPRGWVTNGQVDRKNYERWEMDVTLLVRQLVS